MALRIGLAAIAAFYILSGLHMLLAPVAWYEMVPGVIHTGPYNEHFVRDVAFAYLASGAATGLAAGRSGHRACLASAGAAWPALHALFHVTGWGMRDLPFDPLVLVVEILGVVAPAALGAWIAWSLFRETRSIA